MGINGLKIASLTAISHLTKLLVILFIIKQIAVIQGPSGLGLLGNFMSLVSIASSLAGGGVVSGIIKYLAEYSNSVERQQCFLGSSLVYTILFASITCCLGWLCINLITDYTFPNQGYRGYIYFFLLAQFIISLNNFSFGVTNGLGKNSVYAGFLIGGNLIAVIAAYLAIRFYGLWGAVIAITAPVVLPIIPAVIYVIREQFLKTIRFDTVFQDSKLLFKFSIMLFSSALCFPIVVIIIRNQIITILGYESAGFWQAITKLSTAYLSFFSLFLTFYFLPLISLMPEKKRIVIEVNKTMLALGSCFIVMMIVFFIFKTVIIRIVLSDQFVPISDLMLLQMIGDFFRVLGWVIGFVVVAKAATKLYLLGELFQGGVFVQHANLQSVIWAYVITCFLYCLLSILLFIHFFREKRTELKEVVEY